MSPEFERKLQKSEKMTALQDKIRGLFKILEVKHHATRKRKILEILELTSEEYEAALYYRDWVTRLKDRLKAFKEARGGQPSVDFTIYDLFEKFGEKPKCYITGRELDWDWVSFDHFVPSCKGGSNNLDNLRVTTQFFNVLKSDLPVEYIFEQMKQALEYQGYTVIPPAGKETQTFQSVMKKHFEEKEIFSLDSVIT